MTRTVAPSNMGKGITWNEAVKQYEVIPYVDSEGNKLEPTTCIVTCTKFNEFTTSNATKISDIERRLTALKSENDRLTRENSSLSS